ncbi:MAG: helix-turn-helix domain-containing protein [Inquilinus sp.]|uniref:helix-turn-helix domain-containing protein n=1 Tax=Inquilinus sp. TaxID=1932117 RepID=UPI003F372D8D
MTDDPITCDIPTACRLSGIGRSSLYDAMARDEIRSVKRGRRRLVVVASLRAYLEALPTGGLSMGKAA